MNRSKNTKNSKIIQALTFAFSVIAILMMDGCAKTPAEYVASEAHVLHEIESSNACIKNTAAVYASRFGTPIHEGAFKRIKKVCKTVTDFNAAHPEVARFGKQNKLTVPSGHPVKETLNTCILHREYVIFHDNYQEMATSARVGTGPLLIGTSIYCNGNAKFCSRHYINVVFSAKSIMHHCQEKSYQQQGRILSTRNTIF